MENFDRTLLGTNLQKTRELAGLTQKEVSLLANVGVASVSRVERGLAVRLSTINKLCVALRVDLSIMSRTRKYSNLVSGKGQYVIHRADEHVWTKRFDKRRRAPADDEARIQEADERSRLASLGLVPLFQSTLNFVMPRGPQLVLEEIGGPTPYGPTLNYKDYVIYCLRGELIIKIGEDELTLAEGDAIGYMNGLNFLVEPAHPIDPKDRPPLLLRVGANRMGKQPKRNFKKK